MESFSELYDRLDTSLADYDRFSLFFNRIDIHILLNSNNLDRSMTVRVNVFISVKEINYVSE